MPDFPNPIASTGKTHVGAVREENQDSIQLVEPDSDVISTHGYLYGLADGLGGYEHGGDASKLALQTLFHIFYNGPVGQAERNFRDAFREANLTIFREATVRQARMGTTLTAINITGNMATVAHVGDSRLYLVRNERVMCLTNDHSNVGDMVRARLLTPDKLRTHNQRSVLNRCLGIEMFVQADISQVKLQDGDRLLLCSDGFWAVIEDHELPALLGDDDNENGVCDRLVEEAMRRGSDDNISVIDIHIHAVPDTQLDAPEMRGIRRVISFLTSILPRDPEAGEADNGR